jgi:hypothetical protein
MSNNIYRVFGLRRGASCPHIWKITSDTSSDGGFVINGKDAGDFFHPAVSDENGTIVVDSKNNIKQISISPSSFQVVYVDKSELSVVNDSGRIDFTSQTCTNGLQQIDPKQANLIASLVKYDKLVKVVSSEKLFEYELRKLQGDFDSAILCANPMNMFLGALEKHLDENLNPTKSGDERFERDEVLQKRYIAALRSAVEKIKTCVQNTRVLDRYDRGTQTGRFGINLEDGISSRWREAFGGSLSVAEKDRARKNSNKKNGGNATAQQSSPGASVNPTLQELEQKKAIAEADNKIIFVTSSGTNLFTNPFDSPDNIYTILDIMRTENSAYIFESEAVAITTSRGSTDTGSSNTDSMCAELLGKMSLQNLYALVKALKDQSDHNIKLIEKNQTLVNKLIKSASFQLSSIWTGFGGFNFSELQWNGLHFDGSILDRIDSAVQQSLTDASQAINNLTAVGGKAGQQFLDSAASIGKQVGNNISDLLSSFGPPGLTADPEQWMSQLKTNADAVTNALKSISAENVGLCHVLVEVSKISKSPELLKSSINSVSEKAKKDMQKLSGHIQDIKAANQQQESIKSSIGTIQEVIRSKLGG